MIRIIWYPHMCVKTHNSPIYTMNVYIYIIFPFKTLSIYHHFVSPVLQKEMSEPSPVDWPRGMGLSREHESQLSLNEWSAQVNKQPTTW